MVEPEGEQPRPPPPTRSLGVYQVPPETMERLEALQQAIRSTNHSPPGKGLLLSALIYGAHGMKPDGEQLESEIMAPYRRDHPSEDQPR